MFVLCMCKHRSYQRRNINNEKAVAMLDSFSQTDLEC